MFFSFRSFPALAFVWSPGAAQPRSSELSLVVVGSSMTSFAADQVSIGSAHRTAFVRPQQDENRQTNNGIQYEFYSGQREKNRGNEGRREPQKKQKQIRFKVDTLLFVPQRLLWRCVRSVCVCLCACLCFYFALIKKRNGDDYGIVNDA